MKPNKINFPKKIPTISKKKDSISLLETLHEFYTSYQYVFWPFKGIKVDRNNTDQSLKKIDYLIIFLVFSGFVQLLYCVLSGSYPFNSFLSGFISTIGQFVLTVSLRNQCSTENEKKDIDISPERAFGDFVFSSLILHFFVITFLG